MGIANRFEQIAERARQAGRPALGTLLDVIAEVFSPERTPGLYEEFEDAFTRELEALAVVSDPVELPLVKAAISLLVDDP